MKKITFLLMMLLGGTSAALAQKTEDIAISDFNCWGNGDSPVTYQCSKSESTITFNQAWGGGSWWLGTKDASSYQAVVFEFSALSKTVYFEVDQKIDESNTFYSSGTAAAGATSIRVELNKTYRNCVTQVVIKSTEDYDGSTITLSRVYFSGVPEFTQGNDALTLTGSGTSDATIAYNDLVAYDDAATVSITGTVGTKGGDGSDKDDPAYGWGMGIVHSNYDNGWVKSASLGTWAEAATTTVDFTVAALKEYKYTDNETEVVGFQTWNGTLTSASVAYDRASITIGDAGFATMMLPFAASVPDGMTVYSAAVSGENVVLTSQGSIAANTPYVVGGTSGTYTFKGISTATNFSYKSGQLVGTYEASLDVPTGKYILYKDATEGVGFYPAGSNVTIGQCHAYLDTDALAKALRIVLADDEATGISAANPSDEAAVVARYNLNGTEIAAPQQGVNILKMSDGTVRKVMVK